MAEELQELRDRLADLSSSVDQLIAWQRAQQPPAPAPPPSEPPAPSPPPASSER